MTWSIGEVARLSGLTWRAPSCARKIRHATYDEAEAHRLDVLFHHGTDEAGLEVYRCPHCGEWHLGRRRVVEEPPSQT